MCRVVFWKVTKYKSQETDSGSKWMGIEKFVTLNNARGLVE